MSLQNNFQRQDKALERLQKGYERELIRNYQIALKEIRAKIAKLYEKTDGSFNDAVKFNRLANLEKDIAKEIGKLTGKNAVTLKKGIGDMYAESFYRTGFLLEGEFEGARLGFGAINKDTIQRAVENPLDRVGFLKRNRDNQAVLTRQLNERLTQGLIQGKSYGQVAKDIKERFDVGASKAIRITQTEMHRVQSQGRNDGLKQAVSTGVILKKQWVSTLDGSTREDHQNVDGEKVDMDGTFQVGGESLEYPGDPAGSPANVINCRCTHIAVIEGYEPESRAARSIEGKTENIKYTTYNEWKENRILS